MNKQDITRMAREAGAVFPADGSYHTFVFEGSLERFAALVALKERERAALKAEELGMIGYGTLAIAACIRKGDQE